MQGKRAAIYVRRSDPYNENSTTLETQEAACRAHAITHGLDVTHVFHERHTGVDYFERPAMTQLRQLMYAGEIEHAIFYVVDRMSRRGVHALMLLEDARRFGVALHDVSGGGPIGEESKDELLLYVRAWAGGNEWEQTKERMERARRARVEHGGMPTGRKPRYGFRWIDMEVNGKVFRAANYAENESEASIAREVFEKIAAAVPITRIVADLTERGIKSPNGLDHWNRRTILKMVRDPVYKGEPLALKTRNERVRGKTRQLPAEGRTLSGAAPAIVSSELWSAANAQLDRNKLEARRRMPNPENYLLRAGFVYCGECGFRMTVRDARRYPQYACLNGGCQIGMSAKQLDELVWHKVTRFLSQPDLVRRELEANLGTDPTAQDLDSVDRALATARRKARNVQTAIESAKNPDVIGALVTQLDGHLQRERELEAERVIVMTRHSEWEQSRQLLDEVEGWCQIVAANLGTLDYAEKRALLHVLQVKVRVHGTKSAQPRWIVDAAVDLDNLATTSICAPVCG